MAATIIVACGNGVATSHVVGEFLRAWCKQEKLSATIREVELSQLQDALEGADAYVSLVKSSMHPHIPVINGLAFLGAPGKRAELARLRAIITACMHH